MMFDVCSTQRHGTNRPISHGRTGRNTKPRLGAGWPDDARSRSQTPGCGGDRYRYNPGASSGTPAGSSPVSLRSIAVVRRSTTQRAIDERCFPIQVRFVLPAAGLGYTEAGRMTAWLQDDLPQGDFAEHPESGSSFRDASQCTSAGCPMLNASLILSPVRTWLTEQRWPATQALPCHRGGAVIDCTACNRALIDREPERLWQSATQIFNERRRIAVRTSGASSWQPQLQHARYTAACKKKGRSED
jgi:hypothetical protein